MASKKSPLAYLCYAVLIFFTGSLLITPIFHSLNRIEPRILGFPFIVMWIFIVCVAGSASLLCLTFLDDRKEG